MTQGFKGSRGTLSADTAQGLRDSCYSWLRPGVVHGHVGPVYSESQREAVNTVISGVQLAVHLLYSNELPYRAVGVYGGVDVFDSTDLVVRLRFLCTDEFRRVWQYLTAYEIHPYLGLLSRLVNDVNSLDIVSWPDAMDSTRPSSQNPELAMAWNRSVTAFREAVTEKAFEVHRQLMVRTANKKALSCKDYVKALQKISKDLYVQRLELSYIPETNCTPDSIKDDLAALLQARNQRRYEKIWSGLTGYVWKLEKGGLNWKIHLVLFFDGRVVTTPTQAGQIAAIWMWGSKKSGHIAYLLPAKPENYQLCAIGLMKRGVPEDEKQLRKLVHYMTKLDAVMRLSIEGSPRFVTYSRGQLSRRKPSAKKKGPATTKSTIGQPMPVHIPTDKRYQQDPWRAFFDKSKPVRVDPTKSVIVDNSAALASIAASSQSQVPLMPAPVDSTLLPPSQGEA